MNSNGDISFNESYENFTSSPFPLQDRVALLAAFWADVDTRSGAGNIWYRVTQDPALLARVINDIPPSLSPQHVNVSWVLIATWDHVGYYKNRTDKVSSI